jgi:hypothetical protein
MTIKQQGGIFGRNPTFNDVDVENNLTVDGTVTHNGTQNITGQLNVDNLRLDGNNINVQDANGRLVLVPNGTGYLDVFGNTTIRKGDYQDVSLTIANGNATVGNKREILFTDQAGTTAFIRAYGSAYGAGLNNVLQFGSTTNTFNLTPSGNIAFPSGQGIDFSATSGTGTSELFDDYEEGTWTPVVTDGTNTSTPLYAEGHYRKIGSQVTVYIALTNMNTITASLSGAVSITGLPYASKTSLPSLMRYVGTVTYTNMSSPPLPNIYYNGATSVGTGLTAATITSDNADLYAVITYLTN